jgi:hypothetical protein
MWFMPDSTGKDRAIVAGGAGLRRRAGTPQPFARSAGLTSVARAPVRSAALEPGRGSLRTDSIFTAAWSHGMSFLKRIFSSNSPAPRQRVRICVECGMPVAEHKEWCSIRRGQAEMERQKTERQ